MAQSSLRGSLCGSIVSPSYALCGSTYKTTSVSQMRSGPSWSCVAPRSCTRYAMVTFCSARKYYPFLQTSLFFHADLWPAQNILTLPRLSNTESLPQIASRVSSKHVRSWTAMRRCGIPTSTTHPGVSSKQKLVTDTSVCRQYDGIACFWIKHDLIITWTTVSLGPVFSAAE